MRTILALFLLLFAQNAFAENIAAQAGDAAFTLVKDTGKVVLSPLHYDKNDWLVFGGVCAAGSALLLADSSIKDFSRHAKSGFGDSVASAVKRLGDGKYTVPAAAALYGAAYLYKDEKLQRASALSIESFVIAGLLDNAIKVIVNRPRPSADGKSESQFHKRLNSSFPSGHSATVFAMAGVFAGVYDDKPAVAATAYTLAALTAISRVNDNNHWASDAFIGSALGYFTAKAVVRYHPFAGSKTVVLPEWDNGPGFRVAFSF
ncbi:MAG: phosphatase PAP2 family protein [Elusimicrobiaceae bacterium]